jgi:hypothetical protein
VFVEGEKPYISAQGQDVVYGLEGIIDPKASNGVGDWVRDDTPHMPLRERYKHRKLELFSTDILYRIMEEVMRDSAVFDVRDRQFVLDDIRASRVKIDSDYRKVIEGLVAKGELELVRREMQGKIDEFLGVEEEG